MCGIVYSKSFVGKPVNNTIYKRYKAQRLRGTDGFGFYLPQKNKLTHNTREARILRLLKREKSDEIMFHHRLPTSTMNVRNGCHPYSTKEYFENNYVLIHNGVIWNDEDLYKKHQKFGIEYISDMADGSFNDSEALLYEVAMYLEGWQDKIEAQGSMAFVITKRDSKGKPLGVYFGRNYGNPLKMKLTNLSLTLASEGEGEDVEPHKMHFYDYATRKITSKDCIFLSGSTGTRNVYSGFGFGYEAFEDDEFGTLRSARNGMEADKILQRYDVAQLESRRIRQVKDQLMYDNYDNPFDAVLSAESQIAALEKREKILENLVKSDIATDLDTDEYMMIPDSIWYLTQAMGELEMEASAQREQEFFHIPQVRKTVKNPHFDGDFPTPENIKLARQGRITEQIKSVMGDTR